MEYQGLLLDRFQEEAIQHIDAHESVIVSAPTGAGKTVIAEYAIDKAIAAGQAVLYTAPIKALSNQKFRDFTHKYGNKVGIMTGDVTFNAESPVLIMTTEIFRNAIFENPQRFANVVYLILDEVHYLDDAERGSVWEESLIFAPPQINVLCLSATIPNVADVAAWIGKVRGKEVKIVHESKRPIPLEEFCFMDGRGVVSFEQAKSLLPRRRIEVDAFQPRHNAVESFYKILEYLQTERQLPCLYFVFSRRECEAYAHQCHVFSLLSRVERQLVRNRLEELSTRYGIKCSADDHGLGGLLIKGVGYHHAGMVPALKEIVEQLFTEGLIKILFATETFALGINMPANSVVFSSLKKYDGISVRCLKALEYQQMSGRAGRRGIDTVGHVYANLSNEILQRDELERIVKGKLESIYSQFNLSYSTLISLYERVGEDVVKTWDKSFGAFQKAIEAQRTGGKKEKQKVSTEQKRFIKTKLAFLETTGYLTRQGLTSKGRFAKNINGYEVQITELFFGGLFENCDEATVFMMLVSIVYEGRKGEGARALPQELKKTAKAVDKKIENTKRVEAMLGLDEIKYPDFGLARAAYAWAKGKTLDQAVAMSQASAGDLIRNFRLAIQLCRHLQKACSGYTEFLRILDHCLLAVNRDEVNALKQLKAFSGVAVESNDNGNSQQINPHDKNP